MKQREEIDTERREEREMRGGKGRGEERKKGEERRGRTQESKLERIA